MRMNARGCTKAKQRMHVDAINLSSYNYQVRQSGVFESDEPGDSEIQADGLRSLEQGRGTELRLYSIASSTRYQERFRQSAYPKEKYLPKKMNLQEG
ncbi:unnamed protein product [Amoebophrya sp. A120]|nr:unnamed protein product [Amoebophrya sp. A120]|eukprot:GSA120T00007112001.1